MTTTKTTKNKYMQYETIANKTFYNIDAVSGNCFILLVIAS